MTHRVCVAVAVPGEPGASVDALRDRFDPTHRHMPAHITLLAPFTPANPDDVRAALRVVCEGVQPFGITVQGAGSFRPRSPVVFATVVEGAEELAALQASLSAAAGLHADQRGYTPHVTVASRLPDNVLEAAFAAAAQIDGEFTATTVTWFEHDGSGWVGRAEFGLGRGPAPSVLHALSCLGLDYRVIVHRDPVHSVEDAAAARGVEVVDVVKTLVVRRGADDYVLVLVPGGRSISWPKLRAELGVSRLSMPPPEEALAATGFERGTITPFGTVRPWPVIVDSCIAERGEITLGSGARDVAVGVDANGLVAALGATVADVTVADGA